MTWQHTGRRLLREPLVHFLIAGAGVFWVMAGRAPDLGERRIVVNSAVVGALVQRYSDSFHHMPSQDEIDGMIRDYVADQVYYREALRLGLDKDDEVVVRRMRRKLESMAVADAEAATPSDRELQALIDKDPARYSEDPRTTFDQVYVGADTAENRLKANGMLAALRKGQAVSGTPAPIPGHLESSSASDISGTFGDEFTLALRQVPQGQWSGPVASGLGLHLVRVTARAAPEKPTLDRVRQRVENDWRAAAIQKTQAQAYAGMLKGYDVVIEPGK